ncbi:hypothetical protein [Wenyingzhuangia aestuarii]|uniref:hypothetical protein n=1 Tax=Wenyingzhuangia aestuarii TaxID=1647582 RepID=UPI00143B5B7E|nr:hypothetical protein [Wenyingzhuangia aestuarii]NJB82564.1 hypothetical protein [Wenyingzhuangia aestuarii]
MKKIILSIVLLTLVACSKKNNTPIILIKTITVVNLKDNIIEKRIDTLKDTSFNISLHPGEKKLEFIARKELPKTAIDKKFDIAYAYIVDENGENIKFKSNTDFKNFMNNSGYQLTHQKSYIYHMNYTFNKK